MNFHQRDDKLLEMWVVYDHPKDYPDDYVARMHVVPGPRATAVALKCRDLENLRGFLRERGKVCIARSPQDDPCIVETWL